MTAFAITRLRCDSCSMPLDCHKSKKMNVNRARHFARRHGWAYIRRDGRMVDLCPGCAEKTIE